MEIKDRACANGLGVSEATEHIVRDMILLALDETETPDLPEVNRLSARAALVEALHAMGGK